MQHRVPDPAAIAVTGHAPESPPLPTALQRGLDGLEPEYEILGELGRGGTAVVYRARERVLGREVAIKVIRARWLDDEAILRRFAREARLAASLEHPHIVRIYTVRPLPDAALALVMQYIPGTTLKEEVLRRGPLPVERAERVLREIGAALAFAHARGVVHRDVKPDNIFLDERDGSALLADFGVARPLADDAQLTVGGMAMGTPAYMSPEQIDGGAIDGRSDLYGLGLVGWEMLTGQAPWEGETFYNVLHKQKTAELPPLRRLRQEVPVRLRAALEGALRKQPAARWSGVEEFVVRLDRAAEPRWREWQHQLTDWLRDLGELVAPAHAAVESPSLEAVQAAPTVLFPRPALRESPVTDEQRRLLEWHELRAMMDRRTLADAAPGRHPRWRLYPAAAGDHARLLEIPELDAALAELLMETYGALDVLCEDVPTGIEARTGGALPAHRAATLLRSLRSYGSTLRRGLDGGEADRFALS